MTEIDDSGDIAEDVRREWWRVEVERTTDNMTHGELVDHCTRLMMIDAFMEAAAALEAYDDR